MLPRFRSARPLGLALVAGLGATTLQAQPSAATGTTSSNCFPFGCAVAGNAATRYQQVYAAAAFAGPFRFNTVSFFVDPAFQRQLNVGSFDLFVSTTPVGIDGLDARRFDANLGATATWFGTFPIGGLAPSVLSFSGTPYTYDPALGNLLLDFRVDGRLLASADMSAFLGENGTARGGYSRATDFGDGTTGYGLATQFSTVPARSPSDAAPDALSPFPARVTADDAPGSPPLLVPAAVAPGGPAAGPSTVVPEPSARVLLGLGILLAGGVAYLSWGRPRRPDGERHGGGDGRE